MPSISLCMICKNEAEMLPGCLESVRDSVDEMVIVDTGSSDATIEIAREYGARIVSADWTDFSVARNQALAAASGEWVFILDADEELAVEQPQKLHEIVSSNKADAFAVPIINCTEVTEFVDVDNSPRFFSLRFFRREGAYYLDPIHERTVLAENSRIMTVEDVLIVHYGYLKQLREDHSKHERNASLIREWIESGPDDPRALFFLAREVLLKEKQFGQAREILESAQSGLIECGDTSLGADSFVHLISCYEELGLHDEIESTFARGISAYPDYVELRYFFGCYLFKAGRFQSAIEHFGCCLRLSESDYRFHISIRGSATWRALRGLSDAFIGLGEFEKAVVARSLSDRILNRGSSRPDDLMNYPLSPRAQELLALIDDRGFSAIEAVESFLEINT